MLRIVLPVTVVNPVIDVRLIPIIYVLVIDVDVDVAATPAATPTPASTPCRSQSQTRPKPKTPSGDVTRIIIRIIGIGGWSVDDYWVVGRNVDHLGIGLLNYDHLLAFGGLGFYLLLRVGF
jgi:hypothetical protein